MLGSFSASFNDVIRQGFKKEFSITREVTLKLVAGASSKGDKNKNFWQDLDAQLKQFLSVSQGVLREEIKIIRKRQDDTAKIFLIINLLSLDQEERSVLFKFARNH